MRYDSVKIETSFPSAETLYMILLRDPAAKFESMYNFYNLERVYLKITLGTFWSTYPYNGKALLRDLNFVDHLLV